MRPIVRSRQLDSNGGKVGVKLATLAPRENVKRGGSGYSRNVVYRVNLRVKVPGDRAATDERRDKLLKLIDKHGGKNGTPKPRNHVVGIFAEKAAAKAFRAEARDVLKV